MDFTLSVRIVTCALSIAVRVQITVIAFHVIMDTTGQPANGPVHRDAKVKYVKKKQDFAPMDVQKDTITTTFVCGVQSGVKPVAMEILAQYVKEATLVPNASSTVQEIATSARSRENV